MAETPAGRTVTAAARRAQIVAATIDTIAELGYAKTTFARIAERAGLSSTRLISYHFAGKGELMTAVVGEVYAAISGFLAERTVGQPDARSELRAYVTGVVAFVDGHRRQMQALLSIFLNLHDERGHSRSYDADTDRSTVGQVERILRRGQQAGEFREFDTFVMAATIQRSIDGLPFLLQTKPDLDLVSYAEEVVTLFDLATKRSP